MERVWYRNSVVPLNRKSFFNKCSSNGHQRHTTLYRRPCFMATRSIYLVKLPILIGLRSINKSWPFLKKNQVILMNLSPEMRRKPRKLVQSWDFFSNFILPRFDEFFFSSSKYSWSIKKLLGIGMLTIYVEFEVRDAI